MLSDELQALLCMLCSDSETQSQRLLLVQLLQLVVARLWLPDFSPS